MYSDFVLNRLCVDERRAFDEMQAARGVSQVEEHATSAFGFQPDCQPLYSILVGGGQEIVRPSGALNLRKALVPGISFEQLVLIGSGTTLFAFGLPGTGK
jgi:hypothetical protein